MRFGRLGGWLIVAGGAVVAIAIAKYLNGDGLGFGSTDPNGLLVDAALILFSVGAVVLCIDAPAPLDRRPVRAGLASLAVGQLTLLGVSIAVASIADSTIDPAQSMRIYGLAYEAGGGAAALGLLLAGVALVVTPGLPRVVGSVLLAGIVLVGAEVVAAANLRVALPGHAALAAVGLAILGNLGVGLLAISGRTGSQ